ncbi:MAG: hypothetical protein ABH824_03275 [Nanoarchaeota archaeon]|nr:hypothetical protein [Nanoarchaeota archaeon]MBU1631880.1 hypothetical protein [Nanoarchaeota archaeon]MBU1875933.1 hypothetical protein [Nanoarchaeota archaeon]
MWPFDDKETRRIKKIIKEIKKLTVKELRDKGLVSLYLAGTILTKDRTPQSDIDLFGIVTSEFDIIKEENNVNAIFKKKQRSLCGGFETRFRALGVDELEGGKPRGSIAKYIGISAAVKQWRFYKKLWGKRIDFSKFKIEHNLEDEARNCIGFLEAFIKDLKKGKELYPRPNFIKRVLHLSRIEAEKYHNFKFHPSFKKLAQYLLAERKHIIHEAMELRYKRVSKRDIEKFVKEVETYIKDIKERMKLK